VTDATTTYPFDKLFTIIVNNALGETDLAETDIAVHLLGVFGIEWTPTAAHLE
jgi:hypothetical protein